MPKNGKKDGETKSYGWLWTVFLVSACMFTAGVLVGRGNAPVEFDILKLQNEIKALKTREKQAETARYKVEPGFYEALKKPVEKISPPARKPPAKKPPKAPVVEKKVAAKPGTVDKARRLKSEKVLRELGGSDKPLTIQVSSLKDHTLALRTEKELKAKGYNAYVITAMVPGKGVWHRVRLGAFADKKEAEPVLKKLKSEGKKPILMAK
jgi:cell division septation protein DedD